MSKFDEAFEFPMFFDTHEYVISRKKYTREEAAKIISDELMDYVSLGVTRNWNIQMPLKPEDLEETFVRWQPYPFFDEPMEMAWVVQSEHTKRSQPVWITKPLYLTDLTKK